MKHTILLLFVFSGSLLFSAPRTLGQVPPPPENANNEGPSENKRPNLLAQLGLSPEQIGQIRRMNQERQPRMRQARQRMGDAQRHLDMAIYGDVPVSDAEFQTRLKEFQAAEADLAKLRFESELAVRKVLTPEQLIRFREIRRRFAEARQADRPGRLRQRPGDLRPRLDQPTRPIN